MAAIKEDANKNVLETEIQKGFVRPVKAAGQSPGAKAIGNYRVDAADGMFTLANLSNLGGITARADDYVSIDIEVPEYGPSVEVDSSIYEEAAALESEAPVVRTQKDSWIRVLPEKEVEQIYGSEVKPFGFNECEDSIIDFDAVIESTLPSVSLSAKVEDTFFGEKGALVPEQKEFVGFGGLAEGFFDDEGKSLESAKRRRATVEKKRSLEAEVETSAPYRSMSSRNVGQYDVASMQRNILYDFIERNSEDLSKATGITGFFKRRALKSRLEDLTYTAALWHLNSENSMKLGVDYKTIREGVLGAFDTLVSSKGLAKAYKAGRTVDAAKAAVDASLVKYASPIAIQGVDKAEIEAIGTKYAKDSIMPEPVEVAKPSAQESYKGIGRFFQRVAATAALAATVFSMGSPAVESYSVARVAGDDVAVADQADDVYVSYAVEATELPDAYTPVEEAAPVRRITSSRARVVDGPSAPQLPRDSHTNPRAYDMGPLRAESHDVVVADAGFESGPTLNYRSRTGARLAALSQGTPAWDYDDSNIRLAPSGDGLDYTRGGSL